MPTTSVTVRVIESDLRRWTAAANLEGQSISEWIRRQCNGMVAVDRFLTKPLAEYTDFRGTEALREPESAGANGSADRENVQRVPEAPVSGRRVSSSARRGRPRGKGKLRAIEDVAHGTFRKSPSTRSNRVDESPNIRSVPTVISGNAEVFGTVTRENFAEVMATLPKDEIDSWARSLPREILPSHSATSHRHTCLCTFCLEWRKANYIPYGGPGEKKKSRFAK